MILELCILRGAMLRQHDRAVFSHGVLRNLQRLCGSLIDT